MNIPQLKIDIKNKINAYNTIDKDGRNAVLALHSYVQRGGLHRPAYFLFKSLLFFCLLLLPFGKLPFAFIAVEEFLYFRQ
jgi:hypothetical protein